MSLYDVKLLVQHQLGTREKNSQEARSIPLLVENGVVLGSMMMHGVVLGSKMMHGI